jgi:hypothetical protein
MATQKKMTPDAIADNNSSRRYCDCEVRSSEAQSGLDIFACLSEKYTPCQ